MTVSRQPKRGRRAAKRIDLTDMRHLFRDGRVWTGIGIVVEPNGEPHWQIVTDEETGDLVDVLVEIELQPSQIQVSARLRAGMWEVPAVGDEVAVLIPDGAVDFQPVIVCSLSSGFVPATQGPQPGRIVLVSAEVLVHDGNGGAVPLALKSDVDAIRDELHGHEHEYVPGSSGLATTSGGPSVTAPTGTTVLKAK